MEEIKNTISSVCMVSAGICAVRSLSVGQAMRRRIEILLKMILAIVLISPFVNGSISFELPVLEDYELSEYDYSYERYEDALISQTEKNVCDVLEYQIKASGVQCENISAEVNISEDGSIIINKVTVSTDDFEKAAYIIKNCIGTTTEVINERY